MTRDGAMWGQLHDSDKARPRKPRLDADGKVRSACLVQHHEGLTHQRIRVEMELHHECAIAA